MIGTVIIAVIGYSASIFFAALAVISFIETSGKLKSDRAALIRLAVIVAFLVVSISFAVVTRFLVGGAA